MGTGPSKLAESATTEQKSQIGVFVLGRKETQAVYTLSIIFTKMLDANRLFDINKLLSKEGCSSLFTVIQNTIESEFLRLKFPDPKVSSAITGVSTMPKAYYSELESRPARMGLCRDLTHFLVRLITLVAAMAASIKSNRDLKSLMRPAMPEGPEKVVNELKTSDPQLMQLEEPSEASKIPESLRSSDVESFLVNKGNNLFNIRNTNFMIHLDNMLLYDANKISTPVFLVRFEGSPILLPAAASFAPASPSQPSGGYPSQQQLGMPPRQQGYFMPQQPPAPGRTSGATTTYNNANSLPGSLLTRRRRRLRAAVTRRHRRRQHGGASPTNTNTNTKSSSDQSTIDRQKSLFRVNITSIGNTSKTVIFYVNAIGDTYEPTIATYTAQSREPFPTPKPIDNRIGELFQEAERVGLAIFETKRREISKEAAKDGFIGLQSKELSKADDAIKKLKTDFKDLNEKGTGSAPAPYRAFLLASEPVGSNALLHMLCRDEWRNQWVTSVMTYSLFQQLFNDTIDGKMSPRNAEECRKMMKSFSQTGAMIESASKDEIVTSFANMRFADLPDVFKASICAQTSSESPIREESIPGDVAILRKAHNDIRLAYEAYIEKLVPFMMSIVRVFRAFKEGKMEYVFRLDPAFFTSEGTSLAFLENKIAAARLLIGSHLLTVETIYANAIKALELSKKGISTPATA